MGLLLRYAIIEKSFIEFNNFFENIETKDLYKPIFILDEEQFSQNDRSSNSILVKSGSGESIFRVYTY